MTLLVSLVALAVVFPTISHSRGGLALMVLVLLAAGVIMPLAPLASLIAWPVAAAEPSVPLRWFLLTTVTTVISAVMLALLLVAFQAPVLWPWLAAPAAVVHALWTAIFLLGRRR